MKLSEYPVKGLTLRPDSSIKGLEYGIRRGYDILVSSYAFDILAGGDEIMSSSVAMCMEIREEGADGCRFTTPK